MESGRKRGTADGANGASAGGKRARESESFQTGVGSKTKPCTKFFSTSGCPFGEGCHFLHCFPGGYQAVSKMTNLGGPAVAPPSGRMMMGGPPTPTVKTRLCNKYNTAEGCKWGDKCHFAHGERELGKPMLMDSSMHSPMGPRPTGHFAPPPMANPGMATPASFGASATAKISVDASLAGGIIGRGGVNTKQISRVTGAKLAIRDHESDTSLKNIELEGTFDQIKHASAMVRELIVNISGSAPPLAKNPPRGPHRSGGTGSNFKTKMCENFAKGSCTFGDRCHFAHVENELRKPAAA
ncbi:zinc finger CCCH domain-containing protein 14-like [Panicum miliaceum]|uniref:Zinc finger CCCH domain-containing protein 14-like n=1 Tax=Panicum miliaceum TaxID=4540 RepID=A0A3L6QIM3_PANMI|nr:zinc finger CCCH domain-containing protein 14-like [Panicum miliaceum]